ncbi:pilus assembly protein TadG-related protein [Actinoplanes sp. G11-F43]|uniref:pilus assembly protein TadG-related protein n=1 Tax=Actinoplanes sp. G11-F43 TaxID=3424130 RepID=UPI003D3537F4
MIRRFRRQDDGGIALLVVGMAFAVLVMIGLAVDGGGKMRTLQNADNIAAEAARAAGQAIDLDQAAAGGEKVADPALAAAAAQQYLRSAGATGTVSISGDRRQITVTVTGHYNTVLLAMIGYSRLTVTGHGTAQLLTG